MKSLIILLWVSMPLYAMEKCAIERDEKVINTYWEYAKAISRKYPITDALHSSRFYLINSYTANTLILMDIFQACARLDVVVDSFIRLQDGRSLRSIETLKEELKFKALMLRCLLWAQEVERQKPSDIETEKDPT